MSDAFNRECASNADRLERLDQEIEALQDDKKAIYAGVRDAHGKLTADALKQAMKLRRMDGEKRERADKLDAETLRILNAIEAGTANATRTRAARHEAEPAHDPDTGEITDWDSLRGAAPDATDGKASEVFVRESRDAWPDRQAEPVTESESRAKASAENPVTGASSRPLDQRDADESTSSTVVTNASAGHASEVSPAPITVDAALLLPPQTDDHGFMAEDIPARLVRKAAA